MTAMMTWKTDGRHSAPAPSGSQDLWQKQRFGVRGSHGMSSVEAPGRLRSEQSEMPEDRCVQRALDGLAVNDVGSTGDPHP